MTKKAKGTEEEAPASAGNPRERKTSTTFSTRLTSEERALIERAAVLRQWTPSNLIRIGAVEKAAHIINMGPPPKARLGVTAERLARQLFAPQLAWYQESEPERKFQSGSTVHLSEFLDGDDSTIEELSEYHVQALAWGPKDLESLRDALHFGGAEFIAMVLQIGDRLINPRHSTDEPWEEPIDPHALATDNG